MNPKARILELLLQRGAGKTICPSEVLDAALKQDTASMEAVRNAARELVSEGVIDITQKGEVVKDIHHLKGPIRLRLRN